MQVQIGRDTLRAADRPACRTRQCVTQKQAVPVQAVPCGAGAPLSLSLASHMVHRSGPDLESHLKYAPFQNVCKINFG